MLETEFKQKEVTEEKVETTVFFISEMSGSSIYKAQFEPFQIKSKFLIGITGNGNPIPREVAVEEDSLLYNVDLEGDGNNEIIKVESTVIEETNSQNETFSTDGIRLSMEKNNQDIQILETPLDGVYVSDYDVFILDLNGDGKLEVIFLTVGHNYCVVVYEFDNFEFNNVLSFYEGD